MNAQFIVTQIVVQQGQLILTHVQGVWVGFGTVDPFTRNRGKGSHQLPS